MEKEIQRILNRVEVFASASDLPSMRYHVRTYPVDHWWRKQGIDERSQTTITETATGKVLFAHAQVENIH